MGVIFNHLWGKKSVGWLICILKESTANCGGVLTAQGFVLSADDWPSQSKVQDHPALQKRAPLLPPRLHKSLVVSSRDEALMHSMLLIMVPRRITTNEYSHKYTHTSMMSYHFTIIPRNWQNRKLGHSLKRQKS